MWDFFEFFREGLGLALRADTFLAVSVGLLLGMFVGALPGFTTLMAMAILLPLSFFVHPLVGIPFLLGVSVAGSSLALSADRHSKMITPFSQFVVLIKRFQRPS